MINKRINKDPFKVISIILLILFGISIYIILNNKGENNVVLNNKVKSASEEEKKVVVIDMGHGGNDVGAQSIDGKIIEKDISLEIGLKVTEIIGENSNIEVLTTRNTDEYVSLNDRIEFSNDNNADVFVSLHCNADPNGTSSTNGVETFYWKNDTDESYNLANSIQSSIVNSLDVRDREVKRDDYAVVKSTECPSVLVEMGFLTNNTELRNLLDDEYQTKMAQAIVDGIQKYLNIE